MCTNVGHQSLLHCLLNEQLLRAGGSQLPTISLHQRFLLFRSINTTDIVSHRVMMAEGRRCGWVGMALGNLPRCKRSRKGHLRNLQVETQCTKITQECTEDVRILLHAYPSRGLLQNTSGISTFFPAVSTFRLVGDLSRDFARVFCEQQMKALITSTQMK